MSRDALAQLLRSADASSSTPTLVDGLPVRVRQRDTHQRRVRAITATFATALLLIIATTAFLPRPGTPGRGAPDVARLAALDREALLHEQTATLLLAANAAKPQAAVTSPDVLSEIRLQRDRAALILVYEADRAAADNEPVRALAAYRRTIELFPTTYWAGVARQRIKEMST